MPLAQAADENGERLPVELVSSNRIADRGIGGSERCLGFPKVWVIRRAPRLEI